MNLINFCELTILVRSAIKSIVSAEIQTEKVFPELNEDGTEGQDQAQQHQQQFPMMGGPPMMGHMPGMI